MATTVGVFSSQQEAERAVETLQDEGFTEDEISVLARDQGEGGQEGGEQMGGAGGMDGLTDGTAWGTGIGAVGGLLASAGALAIPGIGPILAVGPLASTLTGAVAGGLGGGLLDLGIPEDRGRQFEDDLRQGMVLCIVETDGNRSNEAARIMREAGAESVESHGA